MDQNTVQKPMEYFAAANSYNGFISFFDNIFISKDYEKIYVIKGGPGTGKSSLMRKISFHFLNEGYRVENILCSSDPSSLDGLIIESKNKKIALIDGTAPHERDAKIPGAIDEIINLGANLDKSWLRAKKEEILSLTDEKKKAYETAYFYLESAGKYDEFVRSIYKSKFNYSKAKSKAESILADVFTHQNPSVKTRLISSFNKSGESTLQSFLSSDLKVIRIGGSEYSSSIFLGCCYEILIQKGACFINLPYALNPEMTDALYVPDSNLVLQKYNEYDINTDQFIEPCSLDVERTRTAKMLKLDSLEEAKRWFSIASDIHFRLEKIYSAAMNFEKNNEILSDMITEISSTLEKTI